MILIYVWENDKVHLGTIEIQNVHQVGEDADYAVRLFREDETIRANVRAHHRPDGWVPLVVSALDEIGGRLGHDDSSSAPRSDKKGSGRA